MANPQAKVLDHQFTTGLRQDLETDLMSPGGLLRAQNVEFVKPGRLAKREAFEAIGTGQHSKEYTYLGDVRRLMTGPGGERLICTDENIYTQFEGTDDLCEAGTAGIRCNVAASLQNVFTSGADTGGTITSAQCAVVGDWLWVSWVQRDTTNGAYTLMADVISIESGSRAWSAQPISDLSGAGVYQHRAIAIGTWVYVFYPRTSPDSIHYQAYNLAATTLGPVLSGTALVTDADSANVFDVTVAGSGTNVALLYRTTTSVFVRTYTSSGGVLTLANSYDWGTAVSPNLVGPTSLCIASGTDGTRGIMCIANSAAGGSVRMVSLSQTLTQTALAAYNDAITFGGATRQVSVEICSSTQWIFATSRVHAQDPQDPLGHTYTIRTSDSLATSENWVAFANYIIGSRFHRDTLAGDTVFSLARFSATGQTHLLLCDWGREASDIAYPVLSVGSGVAETYSISQSPFVMGIAQGANEDEFFVACVKILTGAGSTGGQNVITYGFQARSHDRYLNAPALESSVIAGGTPLLFDGSRVVEMGFYSFPGGGILDATPSTTGGQIEQGVYQYCFVYEWADSYGNRHQSAPSLPVTLDLSGAPYAGDTASVAWSLPVLHATRKQRQGRSIATSFGFEEKAPIKIVAYRTDQGGLPPFRRASSLSYPPSVANRANSPANVTWTDAIVDAFLGEVLYTDAGTLAGVIAPASTVVASFGGRIWGVMAERPDTLWTTRFMSSGTIPTPAAEFTIPVNGCGRVNALVPQDGKLYALCSRGIWIASYGDGPTDTGQGAFPEPVFITGTANCTDPRGAVATQEGLFFTGRDQFGTGIYWMRRGEQTPLPIGRRVSAELAACPVVKGAVDRTSKSRVELLIADADDSPTDTRIVYYHYDIPDQEGVGQFTTATYLPAELECLGLWNDVTAIGAVNSGVVSTQTGVLYRDIDQAAADYEIPLVIETGDIRPFGVLGYGQVDAIILLSTLAAPSNLRFEASFDSGATYAESGTWLTSTFTGAAGSPVLRHWEAATKKLELASLRLRFSDGDLPGSESAAGIIWHGYSISAQALGGTPRLGDAERR